MLSSNCQTSQRQCPSWVEVAPRSGFPCIPLVTRDTEHFLKIVIGHLCFFFNLWTLLISPLVFPWHLISAALCSPCLLAPCLSMAGKDLLSCGLPVYFSDSFLSCKETFWLHVVLAVDSWGWFLCYWCSILKVLAYPNVLKKIISFGKKNK